MLKEQRKQTERMVLNMKRKFLEDMGLEKEQVDKILDENSQDIGKAKGDSEKIQKDLDAANAEVESLKGQISDRDKQLETLKNSTGDVEGMKQEIAKLQADNKAKDDAHAAEIKQLKIDAAIDSALTGAKAKNTNTGDDALVGATTLNKAIQKAGGDNKNIFKLVIMHSEVATNLENFEHSYWCKIFLWNIELCSHRKNF